MSKVEPHSPIKFQIPWQVVELDSKLWINHNKQTSKESCFISVASNSKPNFEGFKIHNSFMKIGIHMKNDKMSAIEFNRMLNV